ncbi:hypothetical protein EAF00_003935 [Botryotinia globosa]|nr:hypothetical protein EAF00_003935 [Botryotinia globosa]
MTLAEEEEEEEEEEEDEEEAAVAMAHHFPLLFFPFCLLHVQALSFYSLPPLLSSNRTPQSAIKPSPSPAKPQPGSFPSTPESGSIALHCTALHRTAPHRTTYSNNQPHSAAAPIHPIARTPQLSSLKSSNQPTDRSSPTHPSFDKHNPTI